MNISFVIQGLHSLETEGLCLNLRHKFPDAELIFSTHGNQNLNLPVDRVIVSQDPGDTVGGQKNLNRQILTSRVGISAASYGLVCKIRSDLILDVEKCRFLDYWDKFNKRAKDGQIFSKRVLTTNLFTRKSSHFTYHPSDWFHFGLKEDLLKIWSLPNGNGGRIPEKFLWEQCIEKYCSTPIDSDLSIVNNFVVLNDIDHVGINNTKYAFHQQCKDPSCWTFDYWLKKYEEL